VKSVAGLSILITGGGSGIGAGAARYFASRGARVTIAGRRPEKLAAVQRELGVDCYSVTGDVTADADRRAMVAAALEHGGGLDAFISCAGNMYRSPVVEFDEAKLQDLFNTNVVAAMLIAGLVVPALQERSGAIVFVGSVHTRRAFPGAAPYAATKGALETVTRVLAAELGGSGVRVNCVVPGAVLTELYQRAGYLDDAEAASRLAALAGAHALGRIGTAEEVAEAMAYLICAEWTTGSVLDVDGGLGLGVTDS
jgi:3-oxoacyl-[acyl-carrier protein] reductase